MRVRIERDGLPDRVRARVRRGEEHVKWLRRLREPYAFGGGRIYNGAGQSIGTTPRGPGDCSWFALRECAAVGVELKWPGGDTYTLAEEGEEGEGDYFTLFIKNIPGEADESHVIPAFRHGPRAAYHYAECGGDDNPRADGGVDWVVPGRKIGLTIAERMDEFTIHRHFKGL